MIKKENIEVIDLFCGVGGLSKGLMNEGLLIKTGLDADPACRYNLVTNYWTHFYAAFTSNCTGLTKS
ncbi:hypothetical protein ACQV5I_18540, partial [Leptospira interrogans]